MKKSFIDPDFVLTFLYVGLGTLAVCSIYPNDFLYGDWSQWVLVITFPIDALSFGYRCMNRENLFFVFCIQTFMMAPTFIFLKRISKRNGNNSDYLKDFWFWKKVSLISFISMAVFGIASFALHKYLHGYNMEMIFLLSLSMSIGLISEIMKSRLR
ncbi:MAG: hypothetical protein WCI97_10020 [Bacteroidota bacterium]